MLQIEEERHGLAKFPKLVSAATDTEGVVNNLLLAGRLLR